MENQKKSKRNKYLKLIVKLAISGLALYLVLNKLDTQKLWEVIKSAQWWLLFAALLVFAISQVFSSIRLKIFLEAISIDISFLFNFRLYLTGMFYNLFLPGGIGGDGYKVILLKRQYGTGWKQLVKTVFHDRLNGLVAVLVLIAILFPIVMQDLGEAALALVAIPLGYFIYWLVISKLFRVVRPVLLKISLYSLLIQSLQLVSVFLILLAIHIPGDAWPYLFLFLLSSIAAVVPFTVGGVGAREIVFLYGATYFGTSEALAISVSLLFFVISAVISFTGAFVQPKIAKEKEEVGVAREEGVQVVE